MFILKKIVALLALALLLAVFLYGENNLVAVNYLTLNLDNLPAAFAGLKIVHLSDLHGKSFGKEQREIVQTVEAAKPDLIVFTGDLIDAATAGAEAGLELLNSCRLHRSTTLPEITRWAGTFDALRPNWKETLRFLVMPPPTLPR